MATTLATRLQEAVIALHSLRSPREFRRYVRRNTVRAARTSRGEFQNLQTIDGATKKRIYPNVRRFINRFHARSADIPGLWIIMALQMAISLSILFPLGDWILKQVSPGPPLTLVVGLVAYYAWFFLLLPSKRSGRRPSFLAQVTKPMLVYSLTIVLYAVAISRWFYPWRNAFGFKLAIGFMAGASLISAFMVSMFISFVPYLWATNHVLRQNADAVILERLLQLLSYAEQHPHQWQELPFRRELIGDLDALAVMLERSLPLQYRSRDEVFSAWIAERGCKMAAFARELKKWVTISRGDTRTYFLGQLANLVVCVGSGDWDAFPCVEPSRASTRKGTLLRALSTLRALISTAAPMVLLFVLNRFHISLPDTIAPYVYLGALVWTVIGVLALLDPLYAGKLEAAKSAIQVLSLSKKKD